jgi:hypothetical protein
MKTKIILLISVLLFMFSINIKDIKNTKVIKQNDSITVVDNSIVINNDLVITNDINSIIYLPQMNTAINSLEFNTTSVSNSNHLELYKSFNLIPIIIGTIRFRNNLVSNNITNNTLYIPSKTLGLVGLNSNVYFNMYLYQIINKLGET